MPSPVGGPSGIPGPPVKSDEESLWIFRAGKAAWASITSLVISGLTASRIISTNGSGQMSTPAAISTDQTLAITNITDSSSKDTGCVVLEGGLGAEGAISSGSQIRTVNNFISGTTSPSLSMSSGLFVKQGSGDNFDNGLVLQRNGTADSYSVVVGADDNLYVGYANNASSANAPGDFSIRLRLNASGTLDVYDALTVANTNDSTSSTTGSVVASGGGNFAKNLLARQGFAHGVTSTATATGITTLTNASNTVQIFTGTTTQTVTLPAANALGANISQKLIIKNRSTGNVTVNRAGSDTIDGGTSVVLTGSANECLELQSDGVSEWVVV